jgi:stress-induced-phosphoprotein 1
LDKINYKFNSTLFYNKALCLFEIKDYEGCLLALDKCIRINDRYLKAYIKRGDIYMIIQDYQEALNDFN